MASRLSEVFVTVELSNPTILDSNYKDCRDKNYAIFKFMVTCESDPRYHLKYILTNTYPFMAVDYKSTKIRGVYVAAPEDDMFMSALAEITDNAGYKTSRGWWVSKMQIEKFETVKADFRY